MVTGAYGTSIADEVENPTLLKRAKIYFTCELMRSTQILGYTRIFEAS